MLHDALELSTQTSEICIENTDKLLIIGKLNSEALPARAPDLPSAPVRGPPSGGTTDAIYWGENNYREPVTKIKTQTTTSIAQPASDPGMSDADSVAGGAPRSYVRRQGRMTRGQRRALGSLWPRYALDCGNGLIDLSAVYGRRAFRVLEIGFGNGESLCHMAATNPSHDFLGIEVHRPGIGHLLHLLESFNLLNVRVICADALTVLQQHIADQAFDRVQLFFPDPWPKKRHHKRRIVQKHWANLMIEKLKPGGTIHMATDWQDYANQMLEVLSTMPELNNTARVGHFSERPTWRPTTKFERRGLALGHEVYDLVFRRRLSSTAA